MLKNTTLYITRNTAIYIYNKWQCISRKHFVTLYRRHSFLFVPYEQKKKDKLWFLWFRRIGDRLVVDPECDQAVDNGNSPEIYELQSLVVSSSTCRESSRLLCARLQRRRSQRLRIWLPSTVVELTGQLCTMTVIMKSSQQSVYDWQSFPIYYL